MSKLVPSVPSVPKVRGYLKHGCLSRCPKIRNASDLLLYSYLLLTPPRWMGLKSIFSVNSDRWLWEHVRKFHGKGPKDG